MSHQYQQVQPQGYPKQDGHPQHHQQQVYPPQHYPQSPHSSQPQAGGDVAGVSHSSAADRGAFTGGTYFITHRDTNAILNIDLVNGAMVNSVPGAMVHMAATVQLSGKVKFSMKKLFTGGEMAESKYTGPGRVALAPTLAGDIITLPVVQGKVWKVGKDAFLACTPDVKRESKSQGLSKAFFSGEDLFVYNVSGEGLMWLTSFGAVDRIDLEPNQQHIVDNGHLVAWNCDYAIERAGGTMTSLKTGEGLVCRFTGPGSVYIQTRNMEAFAEYIQGLTASASSGY